MVEAHYGQRGHPKPKRHNAKRCRVAMRQAIIYALADGQAVESIGRKYHKSRHTVLAIREHYPHEIEAAQERIKALIEVDYSHSALKALEKIARQVQLVRSPLKQLQIYDELTERIHALDTPVQKHPQAMSIKLAALRRAKRDKLSVPSAPAPAY